MISGKEVVKTLSDLVLAYMILSTLGLGQTAQITGRVTDSSTAAVPSAEVLVTNIDTGVTRKLVSKELGYFAAPLLPNGDYRVSVRHDGFKSVERSGIELDEGQVLRLDFMLEIGEVRESVSVTAKPSMIETENSTLSSVVDRQKILDMPTLGRNFFALVQIVPGVRGFGNYEDIPLSPGASSRASIAGGAPSSSNYMVDGIAAEGVNSGGFNTFLSVDAIEEFRITTRNVSAEYGRTGGGVMNVISRSGTNQFHGSAWEFLRNRVLKRERVLF